jgi:hypothetical protein
MRPTKRSINDQTDIYSKSFPTTFQVEKIPHSQINVFYFLFYNHISPDNKRGAK